MATRLVLHRVPTVIRHHKRRNDLALNECATGDAWWLAAGAVAALVVVAFNV